MVSWFVKQALLDVADGSRLEVDEPDDAATAGRG